MTNDRKPVISDTPRPPKAPQTERWLSDWATQSDNRSATHTKAPAEPKRLPDEEIDYSDGEYDPPQDAARG